MSLFRVSRVGAGAISIDGVNIEGVPLTRLRSAMAIIPQENQLFRGSVRFNLDPRGERSDEQMWEALTKAQMKSHVQGLPGGLGESAAL
jgi:ABC-type multidrug transport system fused ATPase/permease subunit